MTVEWEGDELLAKAERAAKLGVDQTTAACVQHAKTNHPWQNVTGTLEGSIQMRPAERQGDRVEGEWGAYNVNYAVYLELGTRNMPAYPFLRPAADAEYRNLIQRIREAFANER